MRQPHQPPLPNTTLQIGIAPKTEPLVVVCAYEQPTYIPPKSSGGDDEGSSSEAPGPRPPWWPEDWPWPAPPDEPVVIEAPPPLPNIIWLRLPPDHPYHLPPGYHYTYNLPEGHPGHYYPGMPPYPVIAP